MMSTSSSDKDLIDKLDRLMNNFAIVRERSKHLQQLPLHRGTDLVDRLCRAEYEDVASKHSKLKTENVLGKRKDKHVFDLVKEIEPRKLIVPDSNPRVMLVREEEMQQTIKMILDGMCDGVNKLRGLRKIHDLKSKWLVESGAKREGGLFPHEANLIEVVVFSRIDVDEKFDFIWDLLSDEFDKDDKDSLYEEYLHKTIELIDSLGEARSKMIKQWEQLIKKLPKINERLIEHVFTMTESDKNSTLLYELVQFSDRKFKLKASLLILRLGHAKILKLIEKLLSAEEIREHIVPASIEIFYTLVEKRSEFEDAGEETVKRIISPLLVCLLKDASVFKVIVETYGKLPKTAKEYIEEKYDAILKSLIKNTDSARYVLRLLYDNYSSAESQSMQIEITSLLEAFKVYIFNQGPAWILHLSEILAELVLEKTDVGFLKESSKELTLIHLVKLMIVFQAKNQLNQEIIKQISKKAGVSLQEILLETIFFPPSLLPILPGKISLDLIYDLRTEIIKLIPLEQLARQDFIDMMHRKLVGLSQNNTVPNKPAKPVPVLFMPLMLELIFKMKYELNKENPCEFFMDIITQLIKSGKHRENDVWPGIIRLASFDKNLMHNKIANLLTGEDWQDLFSAVN